MEEEKDILAEQQRELERIRSRRHRGGNMDRVRRLLNIAFLVLAVVGLVLYFSYPDKHLYGMIIIAIGMVLKIAEFFIRFMF
jgi:energy-converting hydrogenase Eha subunit G